MVDVKREDLTLQDWTKGISADEFAWGSYFYSEWIQTWYNTKWFKLGYRLDESVLNYRTDWYPVALSPSGYYGITAFTHDNRLETYETYNWSSNYDWDADWGWALFAMMPNISTKWVNWLTYWTKAIAIRKSYIDVVDFDWLFNPALELLSTTHLADNSGWTAGTGWTITDNWAEHTTGNTGTLTTTFDSWDATRVRIAVKIKDRTAWKLVIDAGSLTDTAQANGWFVMYSSVNSNETRTLTITPSSDFDWTVTIANVHKVDTSKIVVWQASITSADNHPAILRGGDLYIGSWHSVDIVSLQDWWVVTKTLVDENETIVDISQQAWNLIIWTTDWFNSRQYYWNWVDSVASECIEWKWLLVQWVTNTETVCYVLTTSWATTGSVEWYQYRLYAVSGYQRSLLAVKQFYPNSQRNLEQTQYNFQKKFDFNDVQNSKSMCIFLDNLFIPWCDGVYKYWNDIPWMRSVWTKPIKYPFWAKRILLQQRGLYLSIAYTVDWANYLSRINEQRYTAKWYLVSEWIYWDKLGTRKNIEKLKIWFKNIASEDWNIKVYAIVDDDYFWRFTVSWVTNRPTVWDTYTVAHQTTWEVIAVDKTNNIITFRTVNNLGSYLGQSANSLSKVSWDGDNSITIEWYDNMCLIKTIESEKQGYWADLIFGKDFVNNYMPYWYKLQLVIELNTIDSKLTPEIYEISINSDITDIVL